MRFPRFWAQPFPDHSAQALTSSSSPASWCNPKLCLHSNRWLSRFWLHVPSPLLKSYSRLSLWCLRLNKLGLQSTNHVFPKPTDLPVSEAKLPFSFSLSPKPQLLLTTFSFSSSLKLSYLPSSSPVKHFLIPSLPPIFSPSSATNFSWVQLYHSRTGDVVTFQLLPVTPPLMHPQAHHQRQGLAPVIPLLQHGEGS